MKRKILSIALIMIIFFTNYAIAADTVALQFSRDGGSKVYDVATLINDQLYLDEQYNAYSERVTNTDVSIYKYGTSTNLECTNNGTAINYGENKDKYYLSTMAPNNIQWLFYTIKLEEGSKSYNNIATFLYRDAITYNGEKYNVKLNIKNVTKVNNEATELKVVIGRRTKTSTEDEFDISTYTEAFDPGIRTGKNAKMEVNMEYIIVDDNGNEVPISGLFRIDDIDLSQGFFIKDFTPSRGNMFMFDLSQDTELSDQGKEEIKEAIHYKSVNSGVYIFSTTEADLGGKNSVHLLTEQKNKVEVTFTFDNPENTLPHAFLGFEKVDLIKPTYRITTKVTGGSIDPTVKDIKTGENKTISYNPTDPNTQYLKSIKVDGTPVDVNTYKDKYDFNNITKSHTIEVVYANKYKVTHDPKGGSPTPAIQYVLPNGTATTVTEPTKDGYNFVRWQKIGETTPFDYTTKINADTDLEAVWTPIIYHITYITNGGTNDPSNPPTYTKEDTINFQPATRPGYDFKGWYEDPSFTKPKDGISNETGDKTVYAKWEAKNNTKYKVEHYKETTPGNYELAVTDDLTGVTDENVTATPKDFTGFKENTTHADRIPEGKIKEDGSLVLKLYYDKLIYTVTFEPLNDTTIEDQKVPYQDKAVEPTEPVKPGYTFEYWYYKDLPDETRYNFDDPVVEDVDLIAKWTPSTDTEYKVEHYKQNTSGDYDLADTEDLTGVTGATVVANPKDYTGYTENTTHPDRIAKGEIAADGSLVLKLYYDKVVDNTKKPDTPKTSETPKILPKTGETSKTILASIIIMISLLGIGIIKYHKMKDIK